LAKPNIVVLFVYYFYRKQKKSKPNLAIKRPEVIRRYNENMGGVDLLDQLISYYRIFIKSKKWTLRIIFHFLDLAVAASWLEYRADCNRNKIPQNKQLDLCFFRLEVVECLLSIVKPTRLRGRPALNESESNEQPRLKKRSENRPPTAFCHDDVGHTPSSDGKSFASRCKNNNCQSRTRIFCKKCDVHLCLSNSKNCFEEFHKK
jgi:hypothetical protein